MIAREFISGILGSKVSKIGHPRPLFALFVFFKQFEITVNFSWIRTQIIGVEGEPVDHLTITTTR